MKKMLIVPALWALAMGVVCGQTVAMEKAMLNQALKDGSLTTQEVTDRVRMLRELEGVYPVIELDTATREILVPERVITFPGVTKDRAFKRVKEWGALKFGSLDAVTDYEDAETGKIILEGWVSVWHSASYKNIWGTVKTFPEERQVLFSLVITVKDGKAKMRWENLKYKHRIPGYFSTSNIYVPAQEFIYPVYTAFPLAMSDPGTWKGKIDLLNNTLLELNATYPSLEKYVRTVDDDYRF